MTWLFGDYWGARSLDGVSPPDSPENRAAMLRVAFPAFMGFLVVGIPAVGLVALSGPQPDDTSFAATMVVLAVAGGLLTPAIWICFRRMQLWTIHVIALACDAAIVYLGLAVGVTYSPYAATLCWVVLGTITFIIGRRRIGIAHLVPIGISCALLVTVQDGNTAPVARWLIVMGIVAVTASNVSSLVERTRHLATVAHDAQEVAEQARAELADLNRTLEARVVDQVDELARLNGLRRFLAAPVADALLTEGGTELLEPHRRQIAVFFCDLRGFTSFASGAEPEDVVDVLDDYYRTIGEVLKRYEATVGTFAGDGVMAYLGDPVPCRDPAAKAVGMALELRPKMLDLAALWRRRGQPIGFGMGISYGYATLGMIGFEGRNDYTAIGSVVNLAARLCGEACDGEILLDQRTVVALGEEVAAERIEVALKGFDGPVPAYRVAI